jgi:predicted RNase H-like HicB family nuclease
MFIHVTVLLTPITTVIVSGLKPADDVFVPEPGNISTTGPAAEEAVPEVLDALTTVVTLCV